MLESKEANLDNTLILHDSKNKTLPFLEEFENLKETNIKEITENTICPSLAYFKEERELISEKNLQEDTLVNKLILNGEEKSFNFMSN